MKLRLSTLCATAVVAVFMAASPSVKAETVTLQYQHGATSQPTYTVQIAGIQYPSTPVGPFIWHENNVPPNTNFPPPTATFCIEIGAGAQPLPQPGQSVIFDVLNPANAPTINSAVKAGLINNLFAQHFNTAWANDSFTGNDNSTAFQLALWEIIYETTGNPLNLLANNFLIPGFPPATPTNAMNIAQMWLNGINGPVPVVNFEVVALVAPSTTDKQKDLIQDQITIRPRGVVPAPPGVILAGIGFLALIGRSRLVRRKPTA